MPSATRKLQRRNQLDGLGQSLAKSDHRQSHLTYLSHSKSHQRERAAEQASLVKFAHRQKHPDLPFPFQEPPEKESSRASSNIPADLPPRPEPNSKTPDVPNPWIPHKEFRSKREQARCETTIASSTQQLAQLLDECQNLPYTSTHPPERDNLDIPQLSSFDWPNGLIPWIQVVMCTPCITPSPPKFSFKFTEDGAAHNIEVLRRYDFDLGKALKAQENSPLGNGKEFQPTTVLQNVFGLHPLWQPMKVFLKEGSIWPLAELSKEEQQNNIEDALAFGNHKGALQKPELLKQLLRKDVKYGYSLPIPLSSIQLIPCLCMAPMNIMAQNPIDGFGRIIPKDWLTHHQSWKWLSGTSVNSRVQKDLLQACRYGFCIQRLINWALAARKQYPNQRILAAKIGYKSAYHRGILNSTTALHTATQLPDDDLAIITLRLTFGGTPYLNGR